MKNSPTDNKPALKKLLGLFVSMVAALLALFLTFLWAVSGFKSPKSD